MIVFVLYVYLGANIIDKTQKFEDLNRCLYFSERLSSQQAIPVGDGKKLKLTAICRPEPK